jgi:tetratricopeptide (TPR) repeat protein
MNMKLSSPPDSASSAKTIWVFTPSRTDPKDLEFILVQRHSLLKDAVERVQESALTDHKHHLLFVGPRGCGKTHLVTLIVNRLSQDEALTDRLRIAWLNEDETCTTLLEFLLKIHAALEKRYPGEYREDMLSAAYEMKQDAAMEFVSKHLLSALGSRTLLVVTENLDAIFEGLGAAGQKKLRSFIQENPRLSIVATAQRLVEDLSNRNSPFFGFFQTEHLKRLTVEQATELLRNIAHLQEKHSLVEFLATSRGRSRVRAIHHLSGGNHRIYIVLSQFITRDSVDALVEPFMKMVDELTPYYQERIRWLPPMQRKIVEYLCICEGTVPVKEIAKRLFATPQTISSQLQDLREKGYIEANQRGRESLYEISEPLMRICVEVKDNQRLQPLRLLVDFLRVWYDDQDLKLRLGKVEPASASCAYLKSAIQRNSTEGNLRKLILLNNFQLSLPEELPSAIRDGMVQELENAPEGLLLAMQSMSEEKPDEAILCLDEAIAEEATPANKVGLILFRAEIHSALKDRAKEIADYTAVINLPDAPVELVARALFNRGVKHSEAGETQLEIDDYTAVIKLPDAQVDQIAKALVNRGITHSEAGETQLAIADYTAVINLPDAPVELVAEALYYRGITHSQTRETQLAIADYAAVINLPDAPVELVANALFNRGVKHGEAGETQLAIADYTAMISLTDAPVEQVAMALVNRGIKYSQTGETQLAIANYTAVINLPDAQVDQIAKALFARGMTHSRAGETQFAIADYTAVINLPDTPVELVAEALYYRGLTHSSNSRKEESLSDFETLIQLAEAPVKQVVDAQLALSELHFSEGRWNEGFQSLEASLECGMKVQPAYRATAPDLIGVIFSAGLSPEGRSDKVTELLRLYQKHEALPVLGEAVIQHIGNIYRSDEPFPSSDNLEGWKSAWEHAAESVPDFRLSIRLLSTSISFLKAGGKDRSILLDLTSAERSIVEQAFGFTEPAQ